MKYTNLRLFCARLLTTPEPGAWEIAQFLTSRPNTSDGCTRDKTVLRGSQGLPAALGFTKPELS